MDKFESHAALIQLLVILCTSEPQERRCFLTHFSRFPILAHDYIRLPTSLKGRALSRRPALNRDLSGVQARSGTWHCEHRIRNQQGDLARPWALATGHQAPDIAGGPDHCRSSHHSQAQPRTALAVHGQGLSRKLLLLEQNSTVSQEQG